MAIQSSANSFSTATNIQFGSLEMENIWWNAQTFTVPSIILAPPQINNRSGALVNLGSDVTNYEELNITCILDKEWKVYDALYAHFVKRLNVESGEFIKEGTFDVWIQFFDGEGNMIKRFDFFRCRLVSFGGLDVNTQDTEDTLNTLDLSFVFDYMDYDNHFRKAERGLLGEVD